MSGTAYGTIVLHTTPEAAVGGPLALVKTGDMIGLDVEKRSIDLWSSRPSWNIAAPRSSCRRSPEGRQPAATLYLFNETILQADEGCDFDFMRSAENG